MSGAMDPRLKKAREQANAYLRYSGLGFQMAALIGLGSWGGWWLDQRTGWKFPLFALLGSLGGITVALLLLFKETRRGR
jgi:hypothetical protein